MKKALLKSEDNLVSNGRGVIAFSVWTVIKSFMLMFQNNPTSKVESLNLPHSLLEWIVCMLVLFLIMAVLTGPRLYIGISAISEGKGSRKRRGYIILATLIVLLNLIIFAVLLWLRGRPEMSQLVEFDPVAMVIEVTSMSALVELILSARRVRRLRRAEEG